MNWFFNFGWVALLVVAGIRFVVTSIAGVEMLDYHYLNEWELWVYGAGAAVTVASVWHLFFRLRCPHCNAVNPIYKGAEEIDRWVGTKTVMEEIGKGKRVKRSVPTTFVKLSHHYRCGSCGRTWTKEEKREKV